MSGSHTCPVCQGVFDHTASAMHIQEAHALWQRHRFRVVSEMWRDRMLDKILDEARDATARQVMEELEKRQRDKDTQ